jgi:hypothetical protein
MYIKIYFNKSPSARATDCERRCHISFCFPRFSFNLVGKQAPAVPNDKCHSNKLVQESICICTHNYNRKYIAVTYPILRHASHDQTYKLIPLINYLLPASYKTYSTSNSNLVQVPFIFSLQFTRFLSSQTPVQVSSGYRTSVVKKTQQISAAPSIRAICMDQHLR